MESIYTTEFASVRELPVTPVPVSKADPSGVVANRLRKCGVENLDRLYDRFDVHYSDSYPDGLGDSLPAILTPISVPVPGNGQVEERNAGGRIVGWVTEFVDDRFEYGQNYVAHPEDVQREHLYGLCQVMSGVGPVVLGSWALDCFKCPFDAVALMDRTPTEQKVELIRRFLPGRCLVLLPHYNKKAAAVEWRDSIAAMRVQDENSSPVVIASLPQGRRYPSQCTESEIRESVVQALGSTETQLALPPRTAAGSWFDQLPASSLVNSCI